MDKISPCFCFLLLTLHLLNTPSNALPFRGLLFDRRSLVVWPRPDLGHYTSQAWLLGAADLVVLTIRYNSADTEKAHSMLQCSPMRFTSHPQSEHSPPLNFQPILFTYTSNPEIQRFNLPVTLEHISTTATLKGGEQNQKSYHNTARGSPVLFQKRKRTGLRCRITTPITIIIYI
jgi:hypothetical protein